jgi:hypothetical protein
MPRLRALTSWSGRKAGEEFDAADADARLLCAKDALGGQRAIIVDRAMRAVDKPIEPKPRQSTDEVVDSKRRYLRRDMRPRK